MKRTIAVAEKNSSDGNSIRMSSWSLKFLDDREEAEFLRFINPEGMLATNFILMVAVFIAVVVFEASSWRITANETEVGLLFQVAVVLLFLSAVAAITVWGIYRSAATIAAKTRALALNNAILCAWIVVLQLGQHTVDIHQERRSCRGRSDMYRSSDQQAYSDAYCHRKLALFFATALAIPVVKRVFFRHIAATAGLLLVFSVVARRLQPNNETEIAGGEELNFYFSKLIMQIGYTGFMCFVRYLLEEKEREYFVAHKRMELLTAEVREGADALDAFVRNILPRILVERSSRLRSEVDDESDTAVVLVVRMNKFMHEVTSRIPLDVVKMIMDMQSLVMKELESISELHRTSMFLEEVVAVGNLLKPEHPRACCLRACSSALRMVAEADKALPTSLSAGVHVGHARGSFTGNSWIRYDVSGEAVDAARHASTLLDAKLLVTDEVVAALPGILVVDEGEVDGGGGRTFSTVAECSSEVDLQLPAALSGNPSSTEEPHTYLPSSSMKLNYVAEVARIRKKIAIEEDEEYILEKKWFFFQVFSDQSTEDTFVMTRLTTMMDRAVSMWLGFGVLVLMSFVVLTIDFAEARGGLAAALLVVAALLSALMAVFPSTMKHFGVGVERWHTPWFLLGLVVPTTMVFGSAVSRPSGLGLDLRPMMVVSAFIRSPIYWHARHQLVVTPLMILIVHLQFMLPGGFMVSTSIFYWLLALFAMVADRDSDTAQRLNMIAQQRIEDALEDLQREEFVRQGLVRSMLPTPVLTDFDLLRGSGKKIANTVPDTFVILTTVIPPPSGSPISPEVSGTIEEAVLGCESLHIVKVFGDSHLLLSPVHAKPTSWVHNGADVASCTDEARRVCLALSESSNLRVIVECDTTVQVLDTSNGFMTFEALGVGVTRTRAIEQAADTMLSGVLMTERAVKAFSDGELKPDVQPMAPWSIRGVGIVRLSRLL